MPTLYVSDQTAHLLESIVADLRKGTNNTPSRIVKADVIHMALSEYAKKLGGTSLRNIT